MPWKVQEKNVKTDKLKRIEKRMGRRWRWSWSMRIW